MYQSINFGVIGVQETDLEKKMQLAKRHGFTHMEAGADEVTACGVEKVNLWPKRREDFPVMWGQLLENQAVSITSSGFGNIEINAHGCDKGDGLLHLCEYLTISRENVMAAGDNLNDGPMLRFAGESVAMGNAIDDVKNIAKYIAKTNLEDGVAEMVERLVLKKEI